MKLRNHSIMGATGAIASYSLLYSQFMRENQPESMFGLCVTVMAAGLLGSSLPDVDMILKLVGIRHRSITHSILFVMVFVVAASYFRVVTGLGLLYYFFLGLTIGIVCHLIGDMTTISGVMLLYPKNNSYTILPNYLLCRTGSLIEYIYTGIFSAAMIFLSLIAFAPGLILGLFKYI